MKTIISSLLQTLLLLQLVKKGHSYDDFDKDCVKVHNELRALHNASALFWSESLALEAQKWAEQLAYRDRAEHDYEELITKGEGENIAWMTKPVDKCQGPKKPGCVTCGDIVRKWYSEGTNYNYKTGDAIDSAKPISHFNQVVWKSTAEVGMGSARGDKHGLILVARYSPMGSTGGISSFLDNVSPPVGDLPQDASAQQPPAGQTTIIKITKVIQKIPGVNVSEPSPPPAAAGIASNKTLLGPSTPPPAVPTVPGPTETPMTCGVRKPSRIVGGEIAYPGAWPWQTGLKRNADDIIFCGASLINKEWIVTASHCVYDMLKANKDTTLIALLGEFDKANKEEQEISVKTKKIIMHEGYDPTTLDNDIALIKMETPLKEFSVYVRPVCMPDKDTKFDEQSKCYVTGFGRLEQGGELAGMLRMAKIPLVSQETCRKAYGGKLTDRMLCAGFPKGGIDACQGDSGGPLSCLYEGRWYLTGVVSWGVGCAQPNAYGVYSKVQELKEWVDRKMKENQ